MDFTCIHIFGHLLSEDIIKAIESDNNLAGNRDRDFGIEGNTVKKEVDYVWSGVRRDWEYCMKDRNFTNDPYGTKSVRKFMRSFLTSLGYNIEEQRTNIQVGAKSFNITAFCPDCEDLPIIIEGDRINESAGLTTTDKCSLDYRAKGDRQQKSPHARMLEYLNATENIYGIVSNGKVIRVIRNSGQLVKLTYMEFDLEKIIEEDHYAEFVILFRLLHASRFVKHGEDSVIFEQYFNQSIESGNRIRAGLSKAVENSMRAIGSSAFNSNGFLKEAYINGELKSSVLHKELIHLIYKLLFLFIIEDRHLIYDENLPEEEVNKIDIYRRFYSAGRFRNLSEYKDAKKSEYHDLWESLFETFKLFEDDEFGSKLGIKPLGGELFAKDSTPWLRKCKIDNKTLLQAFTSLNEFQDEASNWVKINYTALDVEEFGSVYEGILELEAYVTPGTAHSPWIFDYKNGGDRKSTSSYYTRPDLVNNLVKSTLVPVIEEKLKACSTQIEKEKMLLSLKVCDAASGSGHIVLAMARTIAWYLSVVRSGEDNPASKDYREALREVIQKCVYAVDYNPDAVELCKLVLWIEGYCTGKPLTFLDHHVRCGNSVVGVADLAVLQGEIPADAFMAEDKEALRFIKKLNAEEASQKVGATGSLFGENTISVSDEQLDIATTARQISSMPEDTLQQEIQKASKWNEFLNSKKVICLKRACDIYTWAFYKKYQTVDIENRYIYDIPCPSTIARALNEIDNYDADSKPLTSSFKCDVDKVAKEYRFFHWSVEFPEVFGINNGFDVMCGNPPWDKLQMEDEKWFINKSDEIVNAGNQSERNKKIEALKESNPSLYNEYISARFDIICQCNFIKNSGRFKLSNSGKIELSSLFAEFYLNSSTQAWGLVAPIGIAVNDSNKEFFAKLIDENRLISIYCFENKERLFDIDTTTKFCLYTVGKKQEINREVNAGFYLTRVDHLQGPSRMYTLDTKEIVCLNPNTKTCPVFRTSKDAELTSKIYKNSSIIFNEKNNENPWNIRFGSMFNMSTDSSLFYTYRTLCNNGCQLQGSVFIDDEGTEYVPLYEGKMIYLYNHHYGLNPIEGPHPNGTSIPTPSDIQLADPNLAILPYYWVTKDNVLSRLRDEDSQGNTNWVWNHKSVLTFKDVGRAGVARTFVITRIPDAVGVGNTATLLYAECGRMPECVLQAMMSSIVFDYVAKQKAGGNHMSIFIVKQLPIIKPIDIPQTTMEEIVKRVIELSYFNHDLDDWAEEIWGEMSSPMREEFVNLKKHIPYRYDSNRRAIIQGEIDALIAHLYGLSYNELRYILDPTDICGNSCINETFRVLQENEMREFGEYRTKRLVLEAWERFGFNR